MARMRKLPPIDAASNWSAWSPARFQTADARDGFLRSVADTQDEGWAAQAMPNEDRAAQVRWRPRRFLGLNDIAYAHGGRILVAVVQRWMM
jgi:hypothetical protein